MVTFICVPKISFFEVSMSAVRMIDREKLQMIQDLICAFAGVRTEWRSARSVTTA